MLNYVYDASGNLVGRSLATALAPQITGQPVPQVAQPSEGVTFSVVLAEARAATFQWKRDGVDIAAATDDTLVLTNVSATDEGQYTVVVSNSAGSVTSAPAALMLDVDHDGLPDSWERAHFTDPDPTHPRNPANQRSETDPDGDKVSNLDEFLDGTDPADQSSLRPRLAAFSSAGGSVTVTPMRLSYALGETVTVTATPIAPSVFIGWAGDVQDSSSQVTLTMDRHRTMRARFASAVPLAPGLIGLWRGEADAADLIGGHDGGFFAQPEVTAPSVAPRVTASGKVGAAFAFDGTVHVRVPHAPALRPARFTVEAWIFPTPPSVGGSQTIIAHGSSTADFDTWWLGLSSVRLPEFLSHLNHLVQGSFVVPLNEWTHLAATFDGARKRLYANGAQVATREEPNALVYDAAPVPVTIGSDWATNASSARFSGRVDEVGLYDRALSAGEILSIYNADRVGRDFSQPYFTSPARLPSGALGATYSEPLTTILGTSPIGFSLSAGVLPPGMTLSSVGVIGGVPGATGIFEFTVAATDAVGHVSEQTFILQVA